MTVVELGLGSYVLEPPPGHETPPRRVYRSPAVTGPMPTGRWWSSAAFEEHSEPMYAHPLAVRAGADGLGVDAPTVSVGIDAQFGSQSVLAQYAGDLTIGTAEGTTFAETLVDGFSDWGVTLLFAAGAAELRTTLAHGYPFVQVEASGATPALHVPPATRVWHDEGGAVGFAIGDHVYAAFAPSGSGWRRTAGALVPEPPADRLAVAVLPDESPATLALFAGAAGNRLRSTRVEWRYDERAATVQADYRFDAGGETLFALYPHQRRALDDDSILLGLGYDTVRGRMELARGQSFRTTHVFPGALHHLPALGNEDDRLRALVEELAAEGDHHLAVLWPHAERDMYWTGVSLNRVMALVPIAERAGATDAAAGLVAWLKATIEDHLQARDADGAVKTERLYWYDPVWTTVIGYPGGFGAHTALNDHHYQYAYWIRAAVEIARHDPGWIATERWGGMIDLLVRDIATAARDDAQFPFVRHFDVYAGHSWATGRQEFVDGANAESSSEAIAAWGAVLLWGELTGDRALRDLGAFLYATEIAAAEEYWFDVHHENLPAAYGLAMVGQVWGGKSSYSTWWTEDPEPMRGISFIPFTPTSFYLGRRPGYVRENVADLRQLRDPWTYWPDIMWCYEALADPDRALELCDAAPAGYTEGHSESRPHTLSWIRDLRTLGCVDAGVTADTPLYGVFTDGSTRSYVAANLGAAPRRVTFSDGTELALDSATVGIVTKTIA